MNHQHHHDEAAVDPTTFWEGLYAEQEQRWSGRVNAVLQQVASTLEPGAALDLGCGEGGDVVWLAQQGWRAVGVDISATAVGRARVAAAGAGLGVGQAEFLVADLAELDIPGPFDLVTASFFQSPVELPRDQVLRRAGELVATGGHLLITSHAAAPKGSNHEDTDFSEYLPDAQLESLALPEDAWETVVAEVRSRMAMRDGEESEFLDSVVLLRRR